MNREEALAEAVIGERVRAVDMPEGVYIDYHFNGWRINFPSGSSSGYTNREHDETVDWEVYEAPEPKGWDMALVKPPEPTPEPKRRGRRAWVPPTEINDIDDIPIASGIASGSSLVEGQGPWQTLSPEAVEIIKPTANLVDNADFEEGTKGWLNPWLEAGLTSEEKPASGWADYGKGNVK